MYTFRHSLLEDDIRPEDTPVPDVEANVLHAIAVYTAGMWQHYEMAEAEEETWSEDEMSDEEEEGDEEKVDDGDTVADEEEVGDKEPKVKVEQKASDKEESEAQKAGEEEAALQDQKPKGEMVCLEAIAVEEVVLTSRRRYHTVRDTYANPLWVGTGKSCQRSPGGYLLD